MANLILRSSTNQPLTFAELDGNFEYFTGSHSVTGSITASQGFYGNITGTASYALVALNGGSGGGTASYVNPLNQNLVVTGSVIGSAGASFQTLTIENAGTINGNNILTSANTSQFVTSVNGVLPTAGNVAISLAGVRTGTSASLIVSSSGANTGSLTPGILWVISGDPSPENNGDVFIYTTGSAPSYAGQWYPVAPLDVAAADARYLRQLGDGAITGSFTVSGSGVNINLLGNVKTNKIVDNSNLISISSSLRRLYDSTGDTVLDWENKTFIGTVATASYVTTAETASYVQNAQTASYVITSQTASYVNPLNQEVILTGNITASGDLRLTTAGNAVVRPIINLVPDGTASYNPNSTNTTAYANYGINLITTASLTNYCFRLPQTPTKGKTVTIINNSGINVVIFPSVVGGEVNGIINGYSILPSDGKSYSFDCYENPLPGGWSLSNSPSTGNTTISTGEINWNYSSSSTSTIAYVNDSIKGFGGGTTFYPPMGSIFLNNYEASTNTFVVNGTTYSYAHGQILPDTIPGQDVWKSIDSIQIQTNITSSQAWWFNIPYAIGNNLSYLYNPNNPNYSYPSSIGPWAGPSWFANSAYTNFSSSIYVPWFASRPGTSGGWFGSAAVGGLPYTISTVPGTFTPSQASPYASDNIGDPGTSILTISNIPAYIGSMSYRWLGRNFIGSFYHPSDGLIDVWYTQAFGLYLQKLGGAFIPNIKFITTLNVQI